MPENRTLLIVDDEPEALKGYQEFLSSVPAPAERRSSRRTDATSSSRPAPEKPPAPSEEYRLLLASTGEQAVELAKKELAAGGRIAAGFFDVKLGAGMDGLSTIQAVRSLDPEIHCVVVTAYHDRTVDEIASLFGAEFNDHWDYLNKPFSRGEIVQKARQMVSAWNRRRQLQALNEQLIRSERMAAIGQVARGVGHEFGNILLRIMGKTDLALMEQDSGKIREHLHVIMTATERASVIVRNLQSIARSTKTAPDYCVASVVGPLDEAISLISHEFTKASLTLERRSASPLPSTRIDAGGMAQVFLNLFINAIHATPKGGYVRTAVEPGPGPDGRPGVLIRVADTGCGITPEVLPRIFEFAFSTKGERGSGLGLSISKEIIEAHGGTITVKTEPGKGSEFSIWIPEFKA